MSKLRITSINCHATFNGGNLVDNLSPLMAKEIYSQVIHSIHYLLTSFKQSLWLICIFKIYVLILQYKIIRIFPKGNPKTLVLTLKVNKT